MALLEKKAKTYNLYICDNEHFTLLDSKLVDDNGEPPEFLTCKCGEEAPWETKAALLRLEDARRSLADLRHRHKTKMENYRELYEQYEKQKECLGKIRELAEEGIGLLHRASVGCHENHVANLILKAKDKFLDIQEGR